MTGQTSPAQIAVPPSPVAADGADLTQEEYKLFKTLVYEQSGINLGDHKMQLVRARLGKHVRQGKFKSFKDYYQHVVGDNSGEEMCKLLDSISTNTTHLFREIRHFNLLHELVTEWAGNKAWKSKNRTLRVWSAACSSGEEPHSIAMTLHDALKGHPDLNAKILATDISTRMLSQAKLGIYDAHRVGTVPADYKNRYFQRVNDGGNQKLQLLPELLRMITFSRFNLMQSRFPFKHGFHIVFCRNVMIYFDKPTQAGLVNRIGQHLNSGGCLMIGHSESLNTIEHNLDYVEPTVYKKK